jgi:hypothetical protein
MAEIERLDTVRFGVTMETSPHAPTQRITKQIEMITLHQALREAGDVGLPPEELIRASDVANVEELIAGRREMLSQVQLQR